MPELPEVEVVRRGLAEHVAGRRVARVEVLHPRAVRRHLPGAQDEQQEGQPGGQPEGQPGAQPEGPPEAPAEAPPDQPS